MLAPGEKTADKNFHPEDSLSQAADTATGKVLLTDALPDEKTAWSKARGDVARLAAQQGFRAVRLPQTWSPRAWLSFAATLRAQAGRGGQVLVEYPLPQRKRLYPLQVLCRLFGIRLHGLVHDLDSLRSQGSDEAREIAVLRLFDSLISHNAKMTSWLRERGISKPVVDLHLFDYLGVAGKPWHADTWGDCVRVVCAGNLEYAKAQYVYDPRLGQDQNVEYALYGVYFEADRKLAANVSYRGVFEPDTPTLQSTSHFGLVWDGACVDSCTGTFGDYLRVNNPHKLSLYVSMGLPVIVWSESAVADFVQDQGIGVAVSSLREIGTLPGRLSEDDYLAMAARATALGERLRRGDFLKEALRRLPHS